MPSPEAIKAAMETMAPSLRGGRSKSISLWGAAYSLLWHHSHPEADLTRGITFSTSPRVIWVCEQKYENIMGVLVHFEIQPDGSVTLPRPLKFATALEMFCNQYEELAVADIPSASVSTVALDWSRAGDALPHIVCEDFLPEILFDIQTAPLFPIAGIATSRAAKRKGGTKKIDVDDLSARSDVQFYV
jgi:hypothetical protein